MRATRIVVVSMILAGAPAMAEPAAADGGAYIDLDRTHYLPGQTAVATTYVSIPTGKQHLLGQGPFYAFLVTGREWPAEGRPIPSDAIRIGTFRVEAQKATSFELRALLSIPDVPGDYYSIAVCNDPCTIDGFREPLTGIVSIVQTRREADLLNERQRLSVKVYGLHRQLRKRGRELDALQAEFDARERDRAYLAEQVNRLNHELSRPAPPGGRPMIETWAAGALAVVLFVWIVAIVVRRRPRTADLAR